MEFSELLAKRRSIRDYQEKEVPLNLVKEIIQESCLAPSATNGQPWRFIIINDRELMQRLSNESKQNFLALMDKFPGAASLMYGEFLRNEAYNVYYNAPCLVLIVGRKKHRSLRVDCALAAGYFMFAATARGLGTCWIGLGQMIQSPELRQEIGLPDDHAIVAPIILGYPKSVPSQPSRNSRILKIA